MSDNVKVLLVGCGYMAGEYYKVLDALGIQTVVVGRSKEGCKEFTRKYQISAYPGGVDANLDLLENGITHAIVATDITELCKTTYTLIEKGVSKLLVEKPGGINEGELKTISEYAEQKRANVYIAYNRRFYQSTKEANRIIAEDGGLKSMHFEFTEWESDILNSIQSEVVRQNILLANSTHVIDLALYFGGEVEKISSFVAGQLHWHNNGCIYSGAGYTKENVLFSYCANWGAPGRWAVELMTSKHRLYFKPMEKLGIQQLNSVRVDEVELDYKLDELYKPGLFEQVKTFILDRKDRRLLTIQQHMNHLEVYKTIAGLTDYSDRIY